MASQHSDLVYDVGLHRGEDTVHYLSRGYRVIAVEASPQLCDEARERFADEIATGRLTIENVAISEQEEPLTFYTNPRSVWGTIYPEWADRNDRLGYSSTEQITVDGTRFGTLIDRHGVPHYLKIDIEGADRLCLEDLRNAPAVPAYVSIESEKVNWSALRDEIALLSSLGYDRFKIIPQHLMGDRKLSRSLRRIDLSGFRPGSSGPFGEDTPGRWLSERELLLRYRLIFLRYRLIGDNGILSSGSDARSRLPEAVRRPLKRLVRLIVGPPGWYDTHARNTNG